MRDLIVIGIVVERILISSLPLHDISTVLMLSSRIRNDLKSVNCRQNKKPFELNKMSLSNIKFISPVSAQFGHTFDLCPGLLQL